MHNLISSNNKTLQSERFVPILLATWITYASYSLLRRPFSIVRSKMISDGSITLEESGVIDTCFLIFYTIGQLYYSTIRATLSRFTSRKLLALGLLGSSLCVFSFGALPIHTNAVIRCFLWCVLGLVQAVGWASCLVVLTPWLTPSERGKLMGLWGTNMALGGVLGNTISSALLKATDGSWVTVFVVCSILTGLLALSLPLWLGGHPNTVGVLTVAQEAKVEAARDGDAGRSDYIEDSFFDKNRTDLEGEWTFSIPKSQAPILSSAINAINDALSSKKEVSSSLSSSSSDPSSSSSSSSPAAAAALLDYNNPSLHVSKIPGVLGIAITYFFHKLVRYVLMMWMPFYLNKQLKMDPSAAGFMSTSFDIGGIVGTVGSGFLADYIGGGSRKALTVTMFGIAMAVTLSGFALGLNEPNHHSAFPASSSSSSESSSSSSTYVTLILCFLSGAFAFGLDSLLTGSLLQDHCEKLGASSRIGAVGAFVGAIGTLGSILQGPFTVALSSYSWGTLFFVMVLMTGVAIISLFPVVKTEMSGSTKKRTSSSSN